MDEREQEVEHAEWDACGRVRAQDVERLLEARATARKLFSKIHIFGFIPLKSMNLWRDVPSGDKPPDLVNVVVEVVSGSRDKYEYNLEWEAFVLDRVLHSSVIFPVEYGFVPKTWFNDNDPLDIMVLSYEPLEVGCIAKTRVIGALIMEDEEGEDPKILAVPTGDPRFDGYNDLTDVHPHKLREIQEFFEVYKRLEPKKWTRFKEWRNAEEAKKIINNAKKHFEEKFVH